MQMIFLFTGKKADGQDESGDTAMEGAEEAS
jgi:hypothetical protein